MGSMRIFIVSYVALHDEVSLVAALRPYRLASFLSEKRVPVTIITPKVGDGTESVIPEGYFISLFKFILKAFAPDYTAFWSIRIFLQMRKEWRRSPFFLFTTCPPYGLGCLGLLLKGLGYQFTWICDFRDLWIGNPLYHPPLTKRFFNPWFEKMFFRHSDIMTFNTAWDLNYNCTRFPFLAKKATYIRNGFDVLSQNTSEPDFRFVYAGGTTKGEATPYVINLLKEMNARGIPATCDFYGEYDKALGDGVNVTYHGIVTPEAMTEILTQYRFGFIYLPAGCELGGRVAQKFYDYLGAGVIPVVFRPSVEMVALMRDLRTGVMIFDDSPVESIVDQLKHASFSARPEELETLTRNFQFERLLNVMMNQTGG